MIEWIFKHLGVVIAVLVIVVQIVRGIAAQRGEQPPPQAKPDELEAERRTREIQEQIRRRRAERADPAARTESAEPPVMRPEPGPQTTQMPEPFGGPLRRVLEELERQANPQPEPVAPPPVQLLGPQQPSAPVTRQHASPGSVPWRAAHPICRGR